jgi:hypothetical protein
MTRAQALDTAADLGINTVEIGLGGVHGGSSPAPHTDLQELLTDGGARAALRRDITSRGLRLEAFNAAGNPLHPVDGARDDRPARRVAAGRGIPSRHRRHPCPGSPPPPATASRPGSPPSGRRRTCGCWSTSGPSLSTTGEPRRRGGAARRPGRHRDARQPTRLQRAQPAAAARSRRRHRRRELRPQPPAVDGRRPARRERRAQRRDPPRPRQRHPHRGPRRRHLPARDDPHERTDERAWNYVAVGTRHPDGVTFWARFVDAIRAAGYHGPLSIENEDYTLGQRESVALAACRFPTPT